MSRWRPCKRRDFINKLTKLGFDGPFSGGQHQFMVYRQHRLSIPTNPEYSISELHMVLQEVEGIIGRKIAADEWNSLD